MNNKFLVKSYFLIWIFLPMLLVGLLFSAYYKSFFPVQPKVKIDTQEITEIPSSIPVFMPFKSEGNGALTILFNGGWKSQLKNGYGQLNNKKIKASVSAMATYTDYPGYMNFDELKGLQNKGWEILSSGNTYNCNWTSLTTEEVRDEVYGAMRKFLSHGIVTQHFSSPCGLVDLRLSDKVAYYYKSQIVGEEGSNQLPLENTYTLKIRTINSKTTLAELGNWLNQARSNNQWVILNFNQISDSEDGYSISKEKFNQVIDKISASNISVVLPSQVIDYNRKEG